jgi:hypothetical protein
MRRPFTRSCNPPRKTRSTKSEPKTVPVDHDYDEIKVPGGAVDWRFNKKIVKEYRFPTVVRISRTKTKGEYYKSVHAAKTIPANKMVGVYMGALIDKSCVRDGRWCVAVPGHRDSKCLDSKITKDWPWERYLSNGAVGGFFNSSRKFQGSSTTNHRGANCVLRWFFEDTSMNTGRIYGVLFTKKRSVPGGHELLWDYPWL